MSEQYNGEGDRRVIVLDGALGTELEARGLRCELPLWSAWALIEAPDAVLDIHRAHARAGADWLTANTFRTQARTLAAGGLAGRARELTGLAVALARQAAEESRGSARRTAAPRVMGSQAPLEDCYRPDLVPDDRALAAEHHAHATALAEAGADGILIETMNRIREARTAAQAAHGTGLPFWISFAVDGDARLLSGEPLDDAIAALADLEPGGVGVNCLAPSAVPASIAVLRRVGRPWSIHPNLGAPLAGGGFAEPLSPEAFAQAGAGWARAGARMLGGCCGTTAEHIAALVIRITEDEAHTHPEG